MNSLKACQFIKYFGVFNRHPKQRAHLPHKRFKHVFVPPTSMPKICLRGEEIEILRTKKPASGEELTKELYKFEDAPMVQSDTISCCKDDIRHFNSVMAKNQTSGRLNNIV